MSSYYYLFKFIVIGDSGVGKSCLVLQFTENQIRKNHDVTIGVEFAVKIVQVEGKNIKLQIWDTAGQENFKSITRSYYRTAIGAVLVYDITRRESFLHISQWLNEMRQNGNPNIVIMLIGNKSDREQHRQVGIEEGQALANENGFLFFETSAKDAVNVDSAFNKLAEDITNKIDQGIISISSDNQAVKIGAEYSTNFYSNKNKDKNNIDPINLNGEKKKTSESSCC